MGSSKIGAKNPLHDPIYVDLAQKIRQCREAAGLTQRDLARLLGVHDSYVGKCERRDRRVDPVELIRWCLACEVDPTEFLDSLKQKVRLPRPRK